METFVVGINLRGLSIELIQFCLAIFTLCLLESQAPSGACFFIVLMALR